MCDLDSTDNPSIFKIIRSVTVLVRIFLHLDPKTSERRKSHGGSGTGHCWITQGELLKLRKNGQEISVGGLLL